MEDCAITFVVANLTKVMTICNKIWGDETFRFFTWFGDDGTNFCSFRGFWGDGTILVHFVVFGTKGRFLSINHQVIRPFFVPSSLFTVTKKSRPQPTSPDSSGIRVAALA